MKIILSAILILILGPAVIFAEDEANVGSVKIRPGMEIKKMGDANILVPKGARLERRAAEMNIEDTAEWAARRFEDVDDRFKKVEFEQEILKKELAGLKEIIEQGRRDKLVSTSPENRQQ
ncbi:MAG: hypothetical protein ABID09_02380 [Candidatus Omnitrophota bacterium]